MKRPLPKRAGGFTMVEMSMTLGIAVLVGGLVFIFLNTGVNLYAKNTAVNAAHQQARSAVDQMLSNIHGSVSIPQLVDANLSPAAVPAASPSPAPGAAGVSFQRFEAGPFLVSTAANVAPTQNYIVITAPTLSVAQSFAGCRLNIPTHKIEFDITSVTGSGSSRTIYLSQPVGDTIITKADGSGNGNGNLNGTSNIIAFITRRMAYAVVCTNANPAVCAQAGNSDKELRYFPTNNKLNYKVIARNVTSSAPFRVLFNQSDALDLRSIAAVDLSTAEPQYSKRGYAAVNMFIKSYIPFRCRLTVYQ